jgi:hypothetical protein
MEIWSTRCQTFNEWEKNMGISNKMKKKIKYVKQKLNTTDEIKDCYPTIINEFMTNHIRYAYNLFQVLTIKYNIGRTLVD